MFGYVMTNDRELSKEEQARFRRLYCGVCQELKQSAGSRGRFTLSFDSAFLALVLNALYEPPETSCRFVCGSHLLGHQQAQTGEMTAYAADVNTILFYYSCMDGWNDDRSRAKLCAARLLEPAFVRACGRRPEISAVIRKELDLLHSLEEAHSEDIDAAAGCFGRLLGAVFAVKQDQWAPVLTRMGDALGRYIYILDAWCDLKSDREKGHYNPLIPISDSPDYEEKVYSMLETEMALCARAFETLPIVKDIHLIRNVLYSGVWTRYSRKRKPQSREDKE